MKLGAHISTRGGVSTAIDRGLEIGCEALQIFTKSQRQWQAKPLDVAEISAFRSGAAAQLGNATCVHASYLINLASPDKDIVERSRRALIDEIYRAAQLQIPYLIVHAGAHTGAGRQDGLQILRDSIACVLQASSDAGQTSLLIENSAGQGTMLASDLRELSSLLESFDGEARLGFCLDTCHLFAAGYDFRTARRYAHLMDRIEQLLGSRRIPILHFNDSAKPIGSRVDKHAALGNGEIGSGPFAFWVQDERWKDSLAILETPGGIVNFARELLMLKGFRSDQSK